ncbi:DMT family transporter [Buttiauxella selenatireducens]|uniref:Threonine/homoserine exporter RhtA n=1 Tax=Buttiauxella selenatireducens TaxID=3073902 RepID=A0ABY9S9N5_9ENTR|nr:DMT family transporter [Buttiauxella sp. R73]WMY74083.1 DMT family transporter [Buttiauxella sp. R73]
MSDSKNSRLALAGLAFITLVWSFHWIVLKSVMQYMGAFDITALRCLLGAILLLILVKVRSGKLKPPPFKSTLLIAMLQTVGMNGLSQLALISGGAGKVAILTYTMPFWAILLAVPLLNERIRRIQGAFMAVALIGLVLILQPWNITGSLLSPILALLSGLSWAASALVIKKMYQRQPHLNLLSLTAWQMLYGALVLCVLAIIFHHQPIVWNGYVVGALAYCAILATAIAWVTWLFVLKHLSTAVASMSTLAIPLLGVLFAWWLLGEVPNTLEGAGIVLIVLGLCGISFSGKKTLVEEIEEYPW